MEDERPVDERPVLDNLAKIQSSKEDLDSQLSDKVKVTESITIVN